MTKPKRAKNRIAGKAKQIVGEVVGDEALHEEGTAQEEPGKSEEDEASSLNPFADLNRLT